MSYEQSSTAQDMSTGELLGRLSEQTSRLVRDEMQLAKTEITDSVKHAGIGAGLFSAAGILALFGFGLFLATAVIALDLVMALWLAGLVVMVLVFAAAAVAGLVGKSQIQQATPTPEQTIDNVKLDVQEVKESRHHEH